MKAFCPISDWVEGSPSPARVPGSLHVFGCLGGKGDGKYRLQRGRVSVYVVTRSGKTSGNGRKEEGKLPRLLGCLVASFKDC